MEEDQIENQAEAPADRAGAAGMIVAQAEETVAVVPVEMTGLAAGRDLIEADVGVPTVILKMAGVYVMLSAARGPRFPIGRRTVRLEAARREGARLERRRVVNIARFSINRS